MDVLKTIVGAHLNNMFLEHVALNVARFLEPADEEKDARVKRYMLQCTLEHKQLKGKTTTFAKYTKNLTLDDEGIYSYGTKVIEIDWFKGTVKRLGRWSVTTSRHQSYAIRNFVEKLNLREIN